MQLFQKIVRELHRRSLVARARTWILFNPRAASRLRRERAWLFGGSVGRAYSDNSAALHQFVRNAQPAIRAYWVIDQDSPDLALAQSRGPVLLRNSVEACVRALLAEVLVVSHGVHDIPGLTSPACRALRVRLGHGITATRVRRPHLLGSVERLNRLFDLVPDYQYLIAFGVPKGNPKNIKGINDVVQGKRTIATITGTTIGSMMRAAGVPTSSIKQFPEPITALRAVAQGQADCFPFYDISLRQLVADGGPVQGVEATAGFELPSSPPMVSGYQFVKQDDTSLRDAFAAQLRTMHDSGQWLQISSRFGLGQANAVPAGFTVDQVCH